MRSSRFLALPDTSQLIVVGDSGLGKTTLIKSLISIPGERVSVRREGGLDERAFV